MTKLAWSVRVQRSQLVWKLRILIDVHVTASGVSCEVERERFFRIAVLGSCGE